MMTRRVFAGAAIAALAQPLLVGSGRAQTPSDSDLHGQSNPENELYQRLLKEAKAGLYGQFPEARGRIEFFDYTADIQKEIERISLALDFRNEDDRAKFRDHLRNEIEENKKNTIEKIGAQEVEKLTAQEIEKLGVAGFVSLFSDSDDRKFAVAFGWPPRPDPIGIIKAFIHEATHGLDRVINGTDFDYSHALGTEALAETVACMTFASSAAERAELIQQVMGGYMARPKQDDSGIDYKRLQSDYVASPYLYSTMSQTKSVVPYANWREVFIEASQKRDQYLSVKQQATLDTILTTISLLHQNADFMNDAESLKGWLGRVSDIPEYKNISYGWRMSHDKLPFQYEAPSVQPAVYAVTLEKLWRLYVSENDPAMEAGLRVLLSGYRTASTFESVDNLGDVLEQVEDKLLTDGVITQKQQHVVDNDLPKWYLDVMRPSPPEAATSPPAVLEPK